MRKFLIALVTTGLLVTAAGAAAAPVQATPEEKASAIVRPAMVYLEQYFSAYVKVPNIGFLQGGDPFQWATRCSGFIVNPSGYIVTAGHCVDLGPEGARRQAIIQAVSWLIDQGIIESGDASDYIETGIRNWGVEGEVKGSPTDREVYVQHGVAAGGLKTGEAKPARVIAVNAVSKGDVALLKIEAENLPVLQIAPTADIQIGTQILSVGYPGSTDEVTDASLEPTFKDGKISAKKTREGGLLPVYEMSAALSGGMSGGPTVDLKGRVVGVNSFSIVGETEAFNFISPSSLISETLTSGGVKNTLGPVDKLYREALDLYFAGDGKAAVKKFEEVLARVPTHKEAQEFKIRATELAATQKSSPVLLIAIIAGVVVVLGGGGFAFSRSRRTKPAFGTAYPGAATTQPGYQPAPSPQPYQPAPAPQEPEPPVPVPAPREPEVPVPAPPEPAPVGFQPPPVVVPPAPAPEPPAVVEPAAASETRPAAPEPAAPAQPAGAQYCASCGTAIPQGARFCANCGRGV